MEFVVGLHYLNYHTRIDGALMENWHDFFLAEAGAAGVLTGLVFVGVSINLEKVVDELVPGLTGRAAEALILLLAVLTVASLMLIPGQEPVLAGVEMLAVGAVAWVWVSTTQVPRFRAWQSLSPNLRQAFVLRVVMGQAAALSLVAAGIVTLLWGVVGLYFLAIGMIFSTLVAMFGAWVLLVEINR